MSNSLISHITSLYSTAISLTILPSSALVDASSSTAIAGATASLVDSKGNVLSTKTANAEGKIEYIIECDTDTELQVTMNDYESNKLVIPGTDEEEVMVEIGLDPIEKIIEIEQVVLNPIYFDYDKSNIRPDAEIELAKILTALNVYPSLKIHIESHTDSRGKDLYNLKLSQSRAQSTLQWFFDKGISKSRLTAKGYGETQLINKCSNGVVCEEDEHQLNRRSMFIIKE